ncbi:hypothetical protein MalM25_36040 [Planctomycetes bacterium MalM25]|nr:hypothetical protein MalM25_36040 [Planctomycetes bacterium MalM25]
MSGTRVAVLACLALLGVSSHAPAQTEWLGGTGDWFEPSNWTAGVPSQTNPAAVNTGSARFDTPATAGEFIGLTVGGRSSTRGVDITEGQVLGEADLTVTGLADIGIAGGTGQGTVRTGEGRLILRGGDLVNEPYQDPFFPDQVAGVRIGTASGTGTDTVFTGLGLVRMTGGSVRSAGFVEVGRAGGTGTRGERHAMGELQLVGGDLIGAGGVTIGTASGTGSTDGFANGRASIVGGDLIVEPLIDPFNEDAFSSLSVGSAGGTGQFDGSAVGVLYIDRGDVAANSVRVGVAGGISNSTSRAEGRMMVRYGDVRMQEMTVGTLGSNGVSASGLVELAAGAIQGESLVIGEFGELVLELGGALPAPAPSSLTVADVAFGKVRVDEVQIAGGLTARFAAGFRPEAGQHFDLIVADQLTGAFSVEVLGLDPFWRDRLTVVRTPTLLRLQFAVPEPASAGTVAMAFAALSLRSRSRR